MFIIKCTVLKLFAIITLAFRSMRCYALVTPFTKLLLFPVYFNETCRLKLLREHQQPAVGHYRM
jgi:hypothetical protein